MPKTSCLPYSPFVLPLRLRDLKHIITQGINVNIIIFLFCILVLAFNSFSIAQIYHHTHYQKHYQTPYQNHSTGAKLLTQSSQSDNDPVNSVKSIKNSSTDNPIGQDSDLDGIPDIVEQTCNGSSICDADGDGVEDYLDLDSNNNTVLDSIEKGTQCTTVDSCILQDSNGDRIPDYRNMSSVSEDTPYQGIYEILGIIFFVMLIVTGYAVYVYTTPARGGTTES